MLIELQGMFQWKKQSVQTACNPTVGVRGLGRNLENSDELNVFQIVLTQSICSCFV